MNEVRRTLLKGMLGSVVAGGIGLPRQTLAAMPVVPERMTLLLPGTAMDTLLQLGAQAAAAVSGRPVNPTALPRRDGILDPTALRDFLHANRGTRVAGLMDDAAYVLFSEMARDAGIALLAEGWHGQYRGAVSRHAFRVAPSVHGIGAFLATSLTHGGESFAVAEHPFVAHSASSQRSRSAHGFDSYRVAHQGQSLCLHLAGLPVASACSALELSPAAVEPLARADVRPHTLPIDASWPVLLGYALCHDDPGCVARLPGMTEVFVRGDAALGQAGKRSSFVSFVADI